VIDATRNTESSRNGAVSPDDCHPRWTGPSVELTVPEANATEVRAFERHISSAKFTAARQRTLCKILLGESARLRIVTLVVWRDVVRRREEEASPLVESQTSNPNKKAPVIPELLLIDDGLESDLASLHGDFV